MFVAFSKPLFFSFLIILVVATVGLLDAPEVVVVVHGLEAVLGAGGVGHVQDGGGGPVPRHQVPAVHHQVGAEQVLLAEMEQVTLRGAVLEFLQVCLTIDVGIGHHRV